MVGKWRARFLKGRLEALYDEPRPGTPRTVSDAQVEQVVIQTLESTPRGETHWSTRGLAKATGLSRMTISRIWHAFGLQPHRTDTFKLSPDPQLIDKVRDIDLVLVTPCDPLQEQRASRMAFCYFCARLGEKLAQGEVKDLAAYDLEQEQGPEFFHLQSYLQLPALARLNEYAHLPELVSSINTMVHSMQVRR
jgi:transposase